MPSFLHPCVAPLQNSFCKGFLALSRAGQYRRAENAAAALRAAIKRDASTLYSEDMQSGKTAMVRVSTKRSEPEWKMRSLNR